jgi:hypothetical protein
MLVKSDENLLRLEGSLLSAQKRTGGLGKELREPPAAQREKKELQTFICSMRGGANGHLHRRIV